MEPFSRLAAESKRDRRVLAVAIAVMVTGLLPAAPLAAYALAVLVRLYGILAR